MVKIMTVMRGDEPAVRQPPVNGWEISWNPDDSRWYVENPHTLVAVATFRERKNAMQYARTHEAPTE